MPGTIGNKNAEKWTEETVMAKLEEIHAEMQKPDCNYLGTALSRVGLYKDIWADWVKKFEKNEVVSRTCKKVTQHFEAKLYERGLQSEVNTTMAIFGLKNNHGWVDKSEVENSGTQTVEVIKRVIGAKPKK